MTALVDPLRRAGLLGALLAASPSWAQAPRRVVLGTATPGGGFPVYGNAVARIVNATDEGLHVETRNTLGSTENIPLLEAGRLDLGLVQGEALYEALAGIGRAPAEVRIVAAMYATAGMFVVRADSPWRSIGDLRGQRVAFGARGSGLVILARYVLEALGLDIERDFEALFLERAGDGPPLLREGRVAALWGGGSQWPGFVAAMQAPGGGRFIVPDAEEIERVLARHSFLKRQTLAAHSYPGQPEALVSVGSWSFIVARPTLDDEIAYRFTRALHRGEQALGQALHQAAETRAVNTALHVPRPDLLHPGTRRYLQEIGALR